MPLRALEEPRRHQSQRERGSDHDGGLPARKPLDVSDEFVDILFFQPTCPGVDLINRLVDVSGNRIVFLGSKSLRARADSLSDACERLHATLFLLR